MERHLNLSPGRLLRFLDEHADDDNPTALGGDVDGPCYPVLALHAHFPQWAFQVLYVRLMNSLEAVSLDQFDDMAKTGLHIGRQRLEFISNMIVEQLYQPSHPVILLHFCNVARG
ncbi:MAG: hypothetical protein WBY44_02190 [Bryobacteraceae bacterium]